MKEQEVFASTQIITFNPIIKETCEVRARYFAYLKNLIRIVKWDRRKYTKAQISFYNSKLCEGNKLTKSKKVLPLDIRFCYVLPFDLAVILGFHPDVIKQGKNRLLANRISNDFSLNVEQTNFLVKEFDAAFGDEKAWEDLVKNEYCRGLEQYFSLVMKNSNFIKEKPYNILITATMSAGKSTLINSLVGKNITRMQNMACTSKIHTIVSKPFEDGVISEYDHDLSMNASPDELLSDNVDNKSTKIIVGTYFNGELAGKRIILFDSPGVNSYENAEHAEISKQIIKSRRYQLMLYVLNATQLGTTDEEYHLEIVRQHIGRTNIIFIMNKVDQLITEDDNFIDVVEGQRKFLVSKGFRNPIICPVSARAAYLVKKSKHEDLSRLERREMENFIDKFEQQSLSKYYANLLKCPPITAEDDIDSLLINSGFAYLEKVIENLCDGGRVYGSNIC